MSKQDRTDLDSPDALSIDDTAKKCGISRTVLYDRIRAGTGPVVRKIGRRSVILSEDRREWLRRLPTTASP